MEAFDIGIIDGMEKVAAPIAARRLAAQIGQGASHRTRALAAAAKGPTASALGAHKARAAALSAAKPGSARRGGMVQRLGTKLKGMMRR